MKPAALHRSLTFWAGLIIITFIAWAWRDSCTHLSFARWKQPVISNVHRGILIAWEPGVASPPFAHREPAQPDPFDWPAESFPTPFLLRARGGEPSMTAGSFRESHQLMADFSGPGFWVLYIPHWLILLATLILWSLLLLWRKGITSHRMPRAENSPHL